MDSLLTSVVAYKAIDHFVTSADARLSYKASTNQLDYIKSRNAQLDKMAEANYSRRNDEAYSQRRYNAEQNQLNREMSARQARLNREHEEYMQELEHSLRREEMDVQKQTIRSHERIAMQSIDAQIRNADFDREARLAMHAQELDQNEQLELRRLHVQQNLADQNEALQKFLFEQGVKSTQEIERFKALAVRETQILLARENAQNVLQDRLVQEAIKNFPLNISPIVLLRNRPHSLKGLLRFSSNLADSIFLPDISQVYNDVKQYSLNPEALNIFIAPIHIGSTIDNREGLSQQIWDSIYNDVESFFTEHYDRRGTHPVILYPTAWKDDTVAGQHASETMHFFLKDMPCLVLEPRFDGHSLSIMMSSWGLGYLSSDHVRTEMRFEINLDAMLIEAAYTRSKKSLVVLDQIGSILTETLKDKRKKLEQNIKYFETLGLDKDISSDKLDEIESIGVYNLFDIVPSRDMMSVTKLISALLCINLAIMTDVHHLQATDAVPVFPLIFKQNFETLYSNIKLRELVSQCYERVFIFLRNQDSLTIDLAHRREMERVRELQITNMKKQLELISEQEAINSMEDKLKKYAQDRHGWTGYSTDELWSKMIENMTVDDIPFFKELLPNVDDRRRYKQIDKKMAELQR